MEGTKQMVRGRIAVDHLNSNPVHQYILANAGKPNFPISKEDAQAIKSGKLKLKKAVLYARVQLTGGGKQKLIDSSVALAQGITNVHEGQHKMRNFICEGVRVGYRVVDNTDTKGVNRNDFKYHDAEVHPSLRNGRLTVTQASTQKIAVEVAETLAIGVPSSGVRDHYKLDEFVVLPPKDAMEWELESTKGGDYSDITGANIAIVEVTLIGWGIDA